MIINSTQFNCELSDILIELKGQLASNGIQRFEKMFDSGDDIMTQCPYHGNGQERKPSFGIRKSDGKSHCFSCGQTVGVDEMIANCFGYSDPTWGYRWLIQNFNTVSVEERKDIELDLDRAQKKDSCHQYFISEEELDSYRYIHPYMYKRGLIDAVINAFDIGYDKQSDSITFPVRYWGSVNNGKCLFVAKRSVKTKRFDLPKNMEKPLYGLYEFWRNIELGAVTDEVYICEGLFDCLRLWCNGKVALAGFGCLFSEYQIKLLEGLPVRKLILALDNDEAGRKATEKLKKRIKNKLITEAVIPNGHKDIGELSDEEIQNLEEVF